MKRGAWLTRADILQALKLSQGKFERGLGQVLKWKLVGSRKKYFLTVDLMPEEARKAYRGMLTDYDGDAEQVEEVLGTSRPSRGSPTAARTSSPPRGSTT